MKKKSSMNWYHQKQRFSLRKYHFGAASVLLGTALVFGGAQVSAEEVTTTGTAENTTLIANETENGEEGAPASEPSASSTTSTEENTSVAPAESGTTAVAEQPAAENSSATGEVVYLLSKDGLESAITSAKSQDLSTKTSDSAAVLLAAIEHAETVLATATSQAELDQAQADLVAAEAQLAEQVVEAESEAQPMMMARASATSSTTEQDAEKAALEAENAKLKADYDAAVAAYNAEVVRITADNAAKEAAYDAAYLNYVKEKAAYEATLAANLANAEAHKNEDGNLSEVHVQHLNFKDETDTVMTIEGGTFGWDQAENSGRGLKVGESLKVTYDGLDHSSYNGKKITKVVYTYDYLSDSNYDSATFSIASAPTTTVTVFHPGYTDSEVALKTEFYYEDGSKVIFDSNAPALISMSSLNSSGDVLGYEYFRDFSGKLIPISGSSVSENTNGRAYALNDNVSKANGSRFDMDEYDQVNSPNAWWASMAGLANSGDSISLIFGAKYSNSQWFGFNSDVKSANLVSNTAVEPTAPTYETLPTAPVEPTYRTIPTNLSYTPAGQTLTTGLNSQPYAGDAITNKGDLPRGTDYTWKTPVDTSTVGDKPATVVVTYPDGSVDEVDVTVKVVGTSATPTILPVDTDDTTVTGTVIPGATVTVTLPDGTTPSTTVNPDGTWSVPTAPLPAGTTVTATQTEPGKDPSDPASRPVTATTADKTALNDPALTPVTDLTSLTPAEKQAVKDEITKANPNLPTGTRIDVADDGTATVVYPDNSKDTLTPDKTVTPKDTSVPPTINPVKPGDTIIGGEGTPGGTVTVTLPDGNTVTVPVNPDGTWIAPITPAKPGDTYTGTQTEPGKKPSDPTSTTVPKTQADDFTPKGQDVPAKVGDTPKAEDGISNKGDLPSGTTYEWKDKPDTTTPGDKPATVVVTYPDGSKDEVPVTVKVTEPAKEDSVPPTINPVKPDDTTIGGEGTPGGTVTVTLPDGNTVTVPVNPDGTWTAPITPAKPGDTYTGTQTEPGKNPSDPTSVTVPKTQADDFTPKGQDVPAKVGDTPKAEDGISNKGDLPSGTTYEWKDKPDTTTPGDKPATVVVTYPDGSKDEVPVTVKVTEPAKEDSVPPTINPVNPGDTTIGGEGTPGGTVTVTLPDGNTVTVPVNPDGIWTAPITPAKPGDTYTGTQTEPGKNPSDPTSVTVPKTQADDFTPKGQDVPAKVGDTPKAEDGISNKGDLPSGTTYEWKDEPDTTTPGDKPATVVVTYPDGSKDEVPVTVKVTDPNKDTDGDGVT
ncbi:TPA: YSIRK-type signal peptide-containing protein, partial [Streptococcus suis]|nr:YSIRK-type signal peptide-containing protein [Streptococcus suis]HEM3721770.1 YSIRK-type signal peptide-containing protein [Streptococcus suis]